MLHEYMLKTSLFQRNMVWTKLSAVATRVARLWLREWRALMPGGLVEWLAGGKGKALCVAAVRGDGAELLLQIDSRTIGRGYFSTRPIGRNDLAQFLNLHRRYGEAALAVEIERDRFFERRFELPAVAADHISELSRAEIERRTPFRLAEIRHGETAVTSADGSKISVTQWIVKTSFVSEAARELGLAPEEIFFVQSAPAADGRVARIMLKQPAPPPKWPGRAAGTLALLAVFLAGGAMGGKIWRQQQQTQDLDDALAQTRRDLEAARARAEGVKRRRAAAIEFSALRARPGLLEIWEEASRLLPADAWLGELHLSDGAKAARTVAVSGFAASAAELVPLFDGSPLFERAALSAAVTPDPHERRERFAIQMNVRAALRKEDGR